MSMFDAIPKPIYDRLFAILEAAAAGSGTLSYFKTMQRAFFPRAENLLAPTLYPWLFIEFGGISGIDLHRFPANWKYEFTIAVVYMTFADRGDVTDLVFSADGNTNKGVGDITADLGSVLWGGNKADFGVEGIIDWTIGRVGYPSVLNIQRLLLSEYIRGLQMDLVFKISETD